MRDFIEDPTKIEVFMLGSVFETSYWCFYVPRCRDSSYLGLFSTFGLGKGVFRFKVYLGEEKWDF